MVKILIAYLKFKIQLENVLDLFFGFICAKYRDPNSDSFFIITQNITKRSTSFLNMSACNFITVYGRKHTNLSFYFN